jgi:hypothetical protein
MTTRRIGLLPPATLITNAEHDFSSGHLTFNRHLPTGPVDGMLDPLTNASVTALTISSPTTPSICAASNQALNSARILPPVPWSST